ncbi:ComEA family DNA-binding protein [Paenibacillus sp. NPDC058174]|uniref:ComEA family DNA-binding protein n=1 Tax=Paenibacillus sp. NPDC058174 TaxID=3346366 RepID=UPI0036DE137A
MNRRTERTKMYILAALFVLAAVMFTVAFALPKEEKARGWEPLNRPVEQALLELEPDAKALKSGGVQAGESADNQNTVRGQAGDGAETQNTGRGQAGEDDEVLNAGKAQASGGEDSSNAGKVHAGADEDDQNVQKAPHGDGKAEGVSFGQPDTKGSGGKEPAGQAAAGGVNGEQKAANGQAGNNSGTAEIADADRGKLDINRATVEQLKGLKGIGPAKAQAIVNEREQRGFFSSADDLLRVKGIGPKLLAGLKDSIVARP